MKFGGFKWEIRTSTTLPVGLLLLKQDGAPPCSACQLMFTLYNDSYIYHRPYRQASEISRIRELGPLGGSTKRRTVMDGPRFTTVSGLIGPMSWFPDGSLQGDAGRISAIASLLCAVPCWDFAE